MSELRGRYYRSAFNIGTGGIELNGLDGFTAFRSHGELWLLPIHPGVKLLSDLAFSDGSALGCLLFAGLMISMDSSTWRRNNADEEIHLIRTYVEEPKIARLTEFVESIKSLDNLKTFDPFALALRRTNPDFAV